MALDKQTYLAHRLALEGKVFYYNELTEPEHVDKFFLPPPKGVVGYNVPKISFPITSDILNNFASLLYRDARVTIEPASMQVRLDEFLARNDWHALGREILTRTLYGATLLATIKPFGNNARIELYNGEWTFIDNQNTDLETIGYMYKVKDGKRVPVIKEPEKADEDIRVVEITDTTWGGIEHNFGFRPAVMFYAPDTQADSPYPLPFHMRYRAPNVKLNQLWSQMFVNSLVLQNVWKTNKDRQDPNNQLSISPFIINHLGDNGTLEQVKREMNIDPELALCDRLIDSITTSAQSPKFMAGLEGIGKVESGVALNIMFGPLVHVTNRLKRDMRPKCVELLTKGLVADYIMQDGIFPPDFFLDVQFTDNVLPVDKTAEMSLIEKADAMGALTTEEKRMLILPLLGLEADKRVGSGVALSKS